MPNYRRNYVPGGTYFFTCVTCRQRPILIGDLARQCLHAATEAVRRRYPFEIIATVLLPDHWHAVWTLPPGDQRYSLRWMRIKAEFTSRWLRAGGGESLQSASRAAHGMRGVWHKRFWEHTIVDEEDLRRCVDYIHWNPRKHELVTRIADWRWSSFHRYVKLGEYETDWGGVDPCPAWDDPEWGELA